MSILILNFSPHERTPYEQLFASLDEPLVLITSKESAPSYPREAYAHVEEIEDYMLNPIVYHRAIQLHKKYQFKKVISGFEPDIMAAAKLREYFQIDGQDVESATHYRNKVIMKQKVAEAGLRVPSFRHIHDVVDLHTFLDDYGYPVIVKPLDSFGSIGAAILRTENDLETFLKDKPVLENVEVEQFINGTLYTVDGIVANGDIAFISVTEAVGGNFIDLDHNGITGSFQLHPKNPLGKRLITYCKQVITALKTPKDTAFHAEIFHTDDDDVVLCEIASRPSGAHIAPSVIFTYGVDLTQAHVQLQAGVPANIPNDGENYSPERLSAWIYFNVENGTLLSLPEGEVPEGVYEYKVFGKIGESYTRQSYGITKVAYMMIEGRSEEELKKRVQDSCRWFHSQVTWDLEVEITS
jgi:biotin carboxylase